MRGDVPQFIPECKSMYSNAFEPRVIQITGGSLPPTRAHPVEHCRLDIIGTLIHPGIPCLDRTAGRQSDGRSCEPIQHATSGGWGHGPEHPTARAHHHPDPENQYSEHRRTYPIVLYLIFLCWRMLFCRPPGPGSPPIHVNPATRDFPAHAYNHVQQLSTQIQGPGG